MPSRIDHVIAADSNLAALEAAFTRLGFSVVGGGTHPHLGTRNRIIVLGDGYIELLGIADWARASPVLQRKLSMRLGGWIGFALQSADIETETAAMRARGVDARGPFPGRLDAPDGTTRSWRVTMIGDEDLWAAAEPLPFLIQHDATGTEHQRQLAGADGTAPHVNGSVRLRDVCIVVRDLAASAASFAQVYGLGAADSAQYDEYLTAETAAFALAAGDERIVLAQPSGDGPAQRRLDDVGEGICAVRIEVADRQAAEGYLRGRGIGYSERDGCFWMDDQETSGISLALVATY